MSYPSEDAELLDAILRLAPLQSRERLLAGALHLGLIEVLARTRRIYEAQQGR